MKLGTELREFLFRAALVVSLAVLFNLGLRLGVGFMIGLVGLAVVAVGAVLFGLFWRRRAQRQAYDAITQRHGPRWVRNVLLEAGPETDPLEALRRAEAAALSEAVPDEGQDR